MQQQVAAYHEADIAYFVAVDANAPALNVVAGSAFAGTVAGFAQEPNDVYAGIQFGRRVIEFYHAFHVFQIVNAQRFGRGVLIGK